MKWNFSRNKTSLFFLHQCFMCGLFFILLVFNFLYAYVLDLSLYNGCKYFFIIQSDYICLFRGVFSPFIFNVIVIYLSLSADSLSTFHLFFLFYISFYLFVNHLLGWVYLSLHCFFPISLLFLHSFTMFNWLLMRLQNASLT